MWNFGIQRQLNSRLFFSATYVGSEIAHLWDNVELKSGYLASGQTGHRKLLDRSPIRSMRRAPGELWGKRRKLPPAAGGDESGGAERD